MQPESPSTPPRTPDLKTRKPWRLLALAVAAILVAGGVGFWAGAYWATPPKSSGPAAEVLLAENLTVPAATYTSAEVLIQWNYWGNASYAGMRLTLAYNASLPIDACLVDNMLVDQYSSCAAAANASVQVNRSVGILRFTVANASVGFTFGLFSPEGRSADAAYVYWINDSKGTTVAGGNWNPLTIPAPQLRSVSVLPAWAVLPSDYDAVFVHGESSDNLSVEVILTAFSTGTVVQGRAWNWTSSYGTSSSPLRSYVYLLFTSGSINPVTVSLVIVAFKS